jgi:outer membrane lipoprotein carrier protein
MTASRKLPTILLICLFVPTAYADSPATQPAPTTRASEELLTHLQGQLKTVETVQADFVQEKKLSVLNHTLTIKGHFALQKPNRLVWIVREPVKYAVRIDGDEIRQWDEDTDQVQVIHLGGDPTFQAVTQQLQAWFMGDYKILAESYDVEAQGDHPLRLGFVPKPDTMVAKVLKRVDLSFGQDDLYIDKMVVQEAGGDLTTLQFNNTRLNQPIPKETWEIPPHER